MKIFLALPTYDGNANNASTMAAARAQQRFKDLNVVAQESSFLTYNFNCLWCEVLNDANYTHFVMLHSDVLPHWESWLDKLVEISKVADADLLSAVSPLKTKMGGTSTALAKGDDPECYRRLTMHEVMALPETFSRRDVANLFGWDYRDCTLLVNTGCMLINLRKRKEWSQHVFDVGNWIKKDKDGKYRAVSEPEDWHMSRFARKHSMSVWATRAVGITHKGGWDYDNTSAWGTLEHEQDPKGGDDAM